MPDNSENKSFYIRLNKDNTKYLEKLDYELNAFYNENRAKYKVIPESLRAVRA